jgi:DnaJ-domain-containing protein 1
VSIGRRLMDMARSELNSLLDVAAKHARADDDDGDASAAGPASSGHEGGSSAWQDEAEWRRRAHQEVEDAIHGRRTAPDPSPPRAGGRTRGGSTGSSARPSAGRSKGGLTGDALRTQKAYAMLEVPPGSDFEAVRQSYRALMRKYHPDHHTQSPEKQRAANDVAQRLTEAYKLLEKRLRK